MNIKKKKTILGMVIAFIILGGLILGLTSKDFMLRLAVFRISPRSAVTMDYEYYKELPENDNGNLYRITHNVPIEEATQGELYTWVVYNYGPFHYAKYYGEL